MIKRTIYAQVARILGMAMFYGLVAVGSHWSSTALLFAQEQGQGPQEEDARQAIDQQKAQAAVVPSTKRTLEVYENEEDLVLVEPNGPRRLVTPRNIHANGRYMIRMKKPDSEVADAALAPKTPSQEDLVKARKHLFDANEAFFKGDLQKTWSLIDEAEKLDPGNYRIMSMKGSLLYRIGSKDLAVPLWEQSLAINPDQPEIRQILEKTVQEKTALDRSVPDKSKGEVKL